MDVLKRERGQLRRIISKYCEEIKNADAKTVVLIWRKMEAKSERLNIVDAEITNLMLNVEESENELDKHYDDMEGYNSKILEARIIYENLNAASDKGTTSNDRGTASSTKTNFKLPTIEWKTFSGDIKEWIGFWGQFQKIDSDEDIASEDKFQYLLQATRGKAKEIVESYPPTGDNYCNALKDLKERFAKKESLIEVYVRELLFLVLNSNKLSVSSLYTKIETQLRALGTLDVTTDNYAAMLYPLVESTLPEDVLRIWQRSRVGGSASADLENLMAFLKHEVEGEERVKQAKHCFVLQQKVSKLEEIPTTSADLSNVEASSSVPTGKKVTFKPSCIFCANSHNSESCYKIRDKTLDEKKGLVIKAKGCFLCLRRGHQSRECRNKTLCIICKRSHHILLCPDLKINERTVAKASEQAVGTVSTFSSAGYKTLLQTLVVRAQSSSNSKMCRVMLDSGSQHSYILTKVAEELKAEREGSVTLVHNLFGGSKTSKRLHNRYKVKLCNLNENISCDVLLLGEECIVSAVPRLSLPEELPDLVAKGIVLSDTGKGCPEIEILLGADYISAILTDFVVPINGMVASKTLLGWTLMGNLKTAYDINSISMNNISEMWDLETIGVKDPIEVRSKQAIQDKALADFNEKIQVTPEGRYEVSLPWSEDRLVLQNNRNIAEKRLINTTKRLNAGSNFQKYNSVLQTWLEDGIIERVEPVEGCETFYLPHRPVFKDSKTTPIRPVFDAGCAGPNGVSLNDCLVTGINLIELIPTILIRFRQGKIGLVSDIRKAFLQISIQAKDRNKLRFLWWEEDKIIEYRHTRLVFGLTCSPFVLAAVLNFHLSNSPSSLSACASKLSLSLYCDNIAISLDSELEIDQFKRDANVLMNLGKFELQDWVDSCKKNFDLENTVSLLGLKWDTVGDTLFCDIPEFNEDFIMTKRKLLSIVQRIYDPLGLLSAVTLIPKLILRECCTLKYHWDQALPTDMLNRYKGWAQNLKCLKNVKIDRYLGEAVTFENITVHIFCDASASAYSACVFIRVEMKDEVRVNFIMCKSRLAPLNGVGNIPRLELLGACIGARLGNFVKGALKLDDRVKFFFWTDSMIVFFWIQNANQKAVFIRNRVKEILSISSSEQWHHINGKCNPADLPSRGCLANAYLDSHWWEGPEWLKRNWEQGTAKIHPVQTVSFVTTESVEEPPEFFRYFSSYTKTIRLMAWIRRFILCLKNKSKGSKYLTSEEIKDAEFVVLKIVQREANSEFSRFETIVDENGLLRVKTKIVEGDFDSNFRYPILLPSKHTVVRLLVQEHHKRFGHVGTNTLIGKLRQNYWICKVRRLVKNITSSCIRCKRYKTVAFQVGSPPLPLDRIRITKIFETTGVDLCGPLHLSNGEKCWIVIFTCAVFRGVHLEVTPSLTTESFVLAVRRFLSRRGQVLKFYSDNGTNMVGLNNLFKSIDLSSIEETFRIKWQFIPPASPWWGGWWERLIRILKDLLKRNLGNAKLDFDELNTLVCECESLMNERPLTYQGEVPDLVPITPSLFLQDLGTCNPIQLDLVDGNFLRERSFYLQTIRNAMRSRFQAEYISQLVHVRKNNISKSPVEVGDIVLIGTDNAKRTTWPLGKVIKVFPGRDGLTRVAEVQTTKGVIVRPIQKLFLMEVTDKNAMESYKSAVPPPISDQLVEEPKVSRRGRVINPPQKLNL